jgi:hypothetical protein
MSKHDLIMIGLALYVVGHVIAGLLELEAA